MRELSVADAIQEALDEELRRDDDVFLLGEDVGTFGGNFGETHDLQETYGPDRVRDTPLSEVGITGTALGAAVGGMRPVAELQFADFAATAGDEMINQIPKMRYISGGQFTVPVTVLAPSGAGIRAGAQHSQSVHAWMGNQPGFVVVTATTPYDAKGLLKSSIRDDNPAFFLPHKKLMGRKGEVPEEEYTLALGEASVEREGTDVTVVATQLLFHRAMAAAEELAGDIDVEVVNPRTFAPINTETIRESVHKTGRLVAVDETPLRYGTQGYVVSEVVSNVFFSFDAPPQTVGVEDTPLPFAPSLEDDVVPSAERIVEAIRVTF
jgi:pyruvate dehydrogenase E1 component beta subunit